MRCWRQSSPANRTKLLQKRRQEPRTSIQARSTGGWYFSVDAVRFLRRGNRAARQCGRSSRAPKSLDGLVGNHSGKRTCSIPGNGNYESFIEKKGNESFIEKKGSECPGRAAEGSASVYVLRVD